MIVPLTSRSSGCHGCFTRILRTPDPKGCEVFVPPLREILPPWPPQDMLRQFLICPALLGRSDPGDSNELGGEEFKTPKTASLVIIIAYNMLLQLSFFILIPSSNKYSEYLGGSATFSGVVIGIPALSGGIALIPMTKYDKGRYARALYIGCIAGILGQVAYAIAYRANFLYLILLGRCLTGVSFTGFMYCKRYCTDPLIVGTRRRTTLCSWLVVGQAIGMSLGPFTGGLLYKVGFQSAIFNGYTSPGWIMAFCYAAFWLITAIYFEDVPRMEMTVSAASVEERKRIGDPAVAPPSGQITRVPLAAKPSFTTQLSHIAAPQWGMIICMCWSSMVCFFVLASWETNLPVFGAATSSLNWSPFAAGNFIALGGVTTFPIFLVNILFARHIQDRHLLALGSGLGLCGLLIFISLLAASKVVYGSLFACWWPVSLGFNLASTVTLSLLSKQLPDYNRHTSMAIQYSNYAGRVTGAIWGGSGVAVGMRIFVGLEIGLVAIGGILFTTLWRNLKAKTG